MELVLNLPSFASLKQERREKEEAGLKSSNVDYIKLKVSKFAQRAGNK